MADHETTFWAACIALVLTACTPMENIDPDVQGHRGCRGLLPENSLPAFLNAVELGCDVLELDVVLSADGEVIVSHEPWMNAAICLGPGGTPIAVEEERSLNLYTMTTAQIQAYDCGSLEHPRFPDQEQLATYKPTLRQVVEAADEHALMSGMVNPTYNIEIKSDPEWYGVHQPLPGPYAKRVIEMIDELGIASRCIVQSFDPAILEVVHTERPDLVVALLVENEDGLDANLQRLTFKPQIYSPYFKLVDKKVLASLRERDIELVVWTVNETSDIRSMIKLGVDGIISDYPDRVILELEKQE
jgi:glycerophosphoryl diester phosphodiesterase